MAASELLLLAAGSREVSTLAIIVCIIDTLLYRSWAAGDCRLWLVVVEGSVNYTHNNS